MDTNWFVGTWVWNNDIIMVIIIDNVKKNVFQVCILDWGNRSWQINRIFPEGVPSITRDRNTNDERFWISGEKSEHVSADSIVIPINKATVEYS